MTDAAHNEDFVNDLRSAMRNSGPGNFRNLFMYAPGGKKEGLQLIPISEVAAKDDFGAIKNISRDDQLAMLRIPPQLMAVVPQNAGVRLDPRRGPGVGGQRTGAGTGPLASDQRLAW